MSSKLVVATRYFDEDLLAGDICYLFARRGMGQFIETRSHSYYELSLEFFSTLHVEVTSCPRSQEGYISFYLNREFYELNFCLLYTSPSPRDGLLSRMPSSA